MAIGTSSGKTYETQFEELIDQPVKTAGLPFDPWSHRTYTSDELPPMQTQEGLKDEEQQMEENLKKRSGPEEDRGFERLIREHGEQMAGKDLDKRTPEPLPILPPVHSIAPHNPNPPGGGGYEIRPGERLSSADTNTEGIFLKQATPGEGGGNAGELYNYSRSLDRSPEESRRDVIWSHIQYLHPEKIEEWNKMSPEDIMKSKEWLDQEEDFRKQEMSKSRSNTKLAMEDRRKGILSDATPIGGRVRGGEGGSGGKSSPERMFDKPDDALAFMLGMRNQPTTKEISVDKIGDQWKVYWSYK